MLNPTNYVEVSNIGLDDILNFMKEKTEEEKNAFKVFAATEIEDIDKEGVPLHKKTLFF